MYNRYVPQPDGSFRRNWMPDAPPPPPDPEPCPPSQRSSAPPSPAANTSRPSKPPQQPNNIGSFFRQLLPRDFCTEDLLVVLLLLLMSGDSKEDQNFALMTLALYLFL